MILDEDVYDEITAFVYGWTQQKAFCPTGEGGGIDNSCSPSNSGAAHALSSAKWIEKQEIGGGHMDAAHKLTLAGGQKAVFKPSSGETSAAAYRDNPYARAIDAAFPPGTRAGREVSASMIDEEMGLGLVPTTRFRDEPDLGGRGSAQAWAKGDDGIYVDSRDIDDDTRSNVAYFDQLIGNVDRHAKNWKRDHDTGEVKLIDNGLSLAENKHYASGTFRSRFEETEGAWAVDMTPRFKTGLEKLVKNRSTVDAALASNGLTEGERASLWARAEYLRGSSSTLVGGSENRTLAAVADVANAMMGTMGE